MPHPKFYQAQFWSFGTILAKLEDGGLNYQLTPLEWTFSASYTQAIDLRFSRADKTNWRSFLGGAGSIRNMVWDNQWSKGQQRSREKEASKPLCIHTNQPTASYSTISCSGSLLAIS